MALSDIVNKVTGNDSPEYDEEFTETDDEYGGAADGTDPKPKRPEAKSLPKKAPPRVPPHVRKEITEKISAMLEFFAAGWSIRDEYCADVLDQQREEITARFVAIVVKRPAMVRYFTEGAEYQDWLMLATALQPVVTAVWSHHVAKTAGREAEQDLDGYAAPPFAA